MTRATVAAPPQTSNSIAHLEEFDPGEELLADEALVLGYALRGTQDADAVLRIVGTWQPYYIPHRDVVRGIRAVRGCGLPLMTGDVFAVTREIVTAEGRGFGLTLAQLAGWLRLAPREFPEAAEAFKRCAGWRHLFEREQVAAGIAAAEEAEAAA